MVDEDKKIIEMSGQFLVEYLPDNFQEWDDDKLYEWVEANSWEPFESWSGKNLLEQIIACARI